MANNAQSTLIKLSDADLTVANSEEDIRGRLVVDRNGDEVGTVDDLMIDTQEQRVRFMRIKSGGFLGFGGKTLMIPVDAITAIQDNIVRVDQTRERIAGAPPYDPELESDDYWERAYGYYGYGPYWGPGYVYPAYPYYPR